MAMYHGGIRLGVATTDDPMFHALTADTANASSGVMLTFTVSACPACRGTGEVGAHSYIAVDARMPKHPCALCSL